MVFLIVLSLCLISIEWSKGDWDFRISDQVKKTLMEPIFNHCGEFRRSPEGPVSEVHSPHLHAGAPGNFSDLLRPVQMLTRENGVRKATGSYHTYSSLVKLKPWFLVFRRKTYFWTELQPWCLSLQWKTCPWPEHSFLFWGRWVNVFWWQVWKFNFVFSLSSICCCRCY